MPTRKQLEELALEHGIDGFVYHHYWFYDPSMPGPTLAQPLLNMLQDGHPNLPFLLNWVDGSWVDTWLGKTADKSSGKGHKILQTQYFPNGTDPMVDTHYQWLRQFFHHPNYIKVQGQPVLMIHQRKPSSFDLLKRLRELAIQDGFSGLYMIMGMSISHAELFPDGYDHVEGGQRRDRFPKYIVNRSVAYPHPLEWMERRTLQIPEWCLSNPIQLPKRYHREIAGILTSFDNTPRRTLEDAHLWSPDPPDVVVERFFTSVQAAVYFETCCSRHANDDSRFVLINAMNEWAEGMALEPSTVYGRRLLQAIRQAKANVVASQCNPAFLRDTNKTKLKIMT